MTTTGAGMDLPTVLEHIVAPEAITRDDFVDDLRGAPVEPDRAAGERGDRAPAGLRRAPAR